MFTCTLDVCIRQRFPVYITNCCTRSFLYRQVYTWINVFCATGEVLVQYTLGEDKRQLHIMSGFSWRWLQSLPRLIGWSPWPAPPSPPPSHISLSPTHTHTLSSSVYVRVIHTAALSHVHGKHVYIILAKKIGKKRNKETKTNQIQNTCPPHNRPNNERQGCGWFIQYAAKTVKQCPLFWVYESIVAGHW